MSEKTNHIKNNFRKSERLRSRILIDLLFAEGKHFRHSNVRCVYLFSDNELESPVQVMFTVPKKNFKKAVSRNLLKRRMREAYRLNKTELFSGARKGNKQMLLAFLYSGNEIEDYSGIEHAVKTNLRSLLKALNRQVTEEKKA